MCVSPLGNNTQLDFLLYQVEKAHGESREFFLDVLLLFFNFNNSCKRFLVETPNS